MKKQDYWYICLSDNEKCPEGYAGYIFPDDSFLNSIEYCREHTFPNITVIDRWINSNDDLEVTTEKLRKIEKKLLKHLSKSLNKLHRTEYAEEEWYVMLGEWLYYYIPQYLDKYKRIKKIEDLGKPCICYVYDVHNYVPTWDYEDFVYTIAHSEEYQKYLYSRLLLAMDKDDRITLRKKGEYNHIVHNGMYTFQVRMKFRVYDELFKIAHLFLAKHDRVVLHGSLIPNDELARICLKNLGLITNYIGISDYNSAYYSVKKKNNSYRRYGYKKTVKDDFFKCLFFLIKGDLPIAYVEKFGFLERRAKRTYRYCYKETKAVLFTASQVCQDEIFKRYLMDIKHMGKARLFVTQHGGNYGIDSEAEEGLLIEAKMADYQYTWGWKHNYSFNTECIPMPAVLFLNRKQEIIKKRDRLERILYIDYSFPKHMGIYARDSIFYKDDYDEKYVFFKTIKKDILDRIAIRVFPDEYGWNEKNRYIEMGLSDHFDDVKDCYESILRSDLCVIPACETVFIEALIAKKPVVCLRKAGNVLSSAEEDVKALEDVGIICNDWDSFRHQIELVSLDLYKWWDNIKLQSAVEMFCAKHAYIVDNAINKWEEEITRLKNS